MSVTSKDRSVETTVISSSPRSSRRRITGLILVVTAVLVIAYAVYASVLVTNAASSNKLAALYNTSAGPLQSQNVPAFSLPQLNGAGTVSSTELAGHPAVLNFFASWCIPCQVETPMIARFARDVRRKALFIGIDEADVRSSALSFIAKAGVNYSVGFDPSRALEGNFELVGLPTTLFILPNGRVSSEVIGQLSASVLARDYHKLFIGAK